MDTAVVGVAGTLLGGLVGGLLAHWNSTALAKLEMRWQVVRLHQVKLEEIAAILDEIRQHYTKLMGEVICKVEYGTAFPDSKERIPFDRLRILIEFYAPSMLDSWPRLERGRDIFAKVFIDALPYDSRTKLQKQDLNGRAATADAYVDKVCRELSAEAARLAHEAVITQGANIAPKKQWKFISVDSWFRK
jgi:hypothetical protein